MKTNYLSFLLLIGILLNVNFLFAQSTEDFESETVGSSTFTDNGQIFNISSITSTYDIFNCSDCGWNGNSTDAQFIDNSGSTGSLNDGTDFTIATNDGTDVIISELYLFCSTNSLTAHTGTLLITGKKENVIIYTITKNSGFSNVSTLSPNNGYTYINFATEGTSDYSGSPVDELIFTSTGNLDYIGLDAFTWDFASSLSIDGLTTLEDNFKIYPNPSSNYIEILNIINSENYKIYNLIGTEVLKGTINNNNQRIDIQNLISGLYFLKFENGNTIKFIKE